MNILKETITELSFELQQVIASWNKNMDFHQDEQFLQTSIKRNVGFTAGFEEIDTALFIPVVIGVCQHLDTLSFYSSPSLESRFA